MGKRNMTVDVARGIAIILVVLGHSIGETTKELNKIILSFHMPLFFFLSGMVAVNKKEESYLNFIKRKSYVMLIPQLTLGIIYTLYELIISYKLLHSIRIEEINIIYNILRWWFLLVLLWVTLIWDGLLRIFKDINYNYLVGTIITFSILTGSVLGKNSSYILFLNVIPTALLFYSLGNLFEKYKMIEKLNNNIKLWWTIIIPILIIIASLNTPVLMYENNYGNYLLFICSSLLGIYLVITIGKLLRNNYFLQLCGINSIIIYVTHFCVVLGTRGVISRIFVSLNDNILSCAVFLVATFILIPVTYICNKYFGLLFGKKKLSKL